METIQIFSLQKAWDGSLLEVWDSSFSTKRCRLVLCKVWDTSLYWAVQAGLLTSRVVNSLDLCPALLKSLGCFYFWCVLSSQWKAVTVNL